MRYVAAIVVIGLLTCTGCESPQIKLSQLQVREMQTRQYDIKDMRRAVKAVLNVLQDEGFIVRQADADLGFLHASKEVNIEDKRERFSALFWHKRRDAAWKKFALVECTANVTEFGRGMRIRLNLQIEQKDNHGKTVSVETVQDPKFYQRFFDKIDQGIFIAKQRI